MAGLVAWPPAAAMMLAATAGGYAGASLAKTLPKPVFCGIIATIGFGMSVYSSGDSLKPEADQSESACSYLVFLKELFAFPRSNSQPRAGRLT